MSKFSPSASQSQLEKCLEKLSQAKPQYVELSPIVQRITEIVQAEKDVNQQLRLTILASKAIYQKVAESKDHKLKLAIKSLTTFSGVKRIIQNSSEIKLGDKPAEEILEIMSVFGEQGEDKFDQYVTFALHGLVRRIKDKLSIEDLSKIYETFQERKTKEFPTQTDVERVEAGKNMMEYQEFEYLILSELNARCKDFLEQNAVIEGAKASKPFKQFDKANLELKFKEGRGIIVECSFEKPGILDSLVEAVSSLKSVASHGKPKTQKDEESALLELAEEIERAPEPFIIKKMEGKVIGFKLSDLIEYQKQIDPKRTFQVTEFGQLVGKEIDGNAMQSAAAHQ